MVSIIGMDRAGPGQAGPGRMFEIPKESSLMLIKDQY